MNNEQLKTINAGLLELRLQAETAGPMQKLKLVEAAVNNAVAIINELVTRELSRGPFEKCE